MKVCVTGANGFVGTALCASLAARGHEVVSVVRHAPTGAAAPTVIEIGDIGPMTDWSKAVIGCDVVVHLAARVHVMKETSADPTTQFRNVNTVATCNLALAAAQAGVRRFVFLSTVKVNGEFTLPGRPFHETDIAKPQDAYAESKYAAEEGLKALTTEFGMEWVIIRPPLVYGPGVKANFAALANAVRRGWPLPLGAIRNSRSLVGIDNLVDFIASCVFHPNAANQTFLISDGLDLSTPELVRKIAQACRVTARVPAVPLFFLRMAAAAFGKASTVTRLCENLQLDVSKASRLLCWKPVMTVEEGIARVMHAHKKQ